MVATAIQTLADQAYEQLEERIITLQLAPGTLLSEAELSRELGIGRTPVREALQRLAADRLVTALPRKGILVTEINITDHLALLETRRVLDRLVASRAARRATAEQRLALEVCRATMQTAADQKDLAAFLRADHTCDTILEAASRNPFAAQALASLHAHCRRFWYRYRGTHDLEQSAVLHGAVLEAVVAGHEDAAESASDALIDYLIQRTREALDLF